MRFDLSDLRLFIGIVEAGSITQGAKQAHLSLAAASERLQNMESDAKVILLKRHPRGVIPTQAGEAVLHHAKLIMQQQHLLKTELDKFAKGQVGQLSLYANTSALTDFLPQRLAVWLAQRPKLQVELKERSSEAIVQAVKSGLVEAGIVSDAVFSEAMLADVVLQPLAKDDLKLIVSLNHPLATKAAVAFRAIIHEPFIALSVGNALQDFIDTQAKPMGGLTTRIAMKTVESVCQMVEHDVGVGILPQGIVERQQLHYRFHAIALTDIWAQRNLCACYQDWQRLSPAMQSLLEFLTGEICKDWIRIE